MIGIASIVDINSPEWRENPVAYLMEIEKEVRALNKLNHLGGIVVDVGGKKFAMQISTTVRSCCDQREETTQIFVEQAREITNWPKGNKDKKAKHMAIGDIKMRCPDSTEELCRRFNQSANFPASHSGKDFVRTFSLG